MKSLFVLLIVLGILFAALAPVLAGDVPPECIPDPIITFQHYGDNQVDLLFDPRLSTDCFTQDGNPDKPYEVTSIITSIHHHKRIGQTKDWEITRIFHDWGVWNGAALASQNFGGPYYSVGGGINITGDSLALNNCYSIVVTVTGSHNDEDASADENWFEYASYGDCIPGPDTIEIASPFRERPGGLVPVPDPTHRTGQPGSLKTGTSR